jgi:membrane protein YqaA with SNARE-associated domain
MRPDVAPDFSQPAACNAAPELAPPTYVESERPPQPKVWQSALLIASTVALTVGLFFIPADFVERLGAYGYLGVVVLTLLSSATIVLPSPALGVVALAGKTLNPWLVGGLGGVAASLGEITGYMVGLGGSSLAARSRLYPRVEHWVRRWGVLTIFVLAVIPSPVFDLAGIAAGTMRMPFRRYFVACLCGKVLRFILVAWVGYYLGN